MIRWYAIALFLVFSACSGPGVIETGNPKFYISGTKEGDLGVWQIQEDAFSLDWKVAAPTTGQVLYSYQVSGTCGVAGAYGFVPCTLTGASCSAGTSACPGSVPAVGDVYDLLELPGVALFAYANAQPALHIGIVRDDCTADVEGDYVYLNNALNRQEAFGIFRTDSAVQTLVKSGFAFNHPGTPALFYYTTDGGGTGALTVSGTTSCENGVRTIPFGGNVVARATLTASGLMLLSYPPPFGGAFAFRRDRAATLPELAGKNFLGFVFKEGGGSSMARLTTGAYGSTGVAFSGLSYQTGPQPDLTGHQIQSTGVGGASLGFTGVPPGFFGLTFADNLVSSTYPIPSLIPGVFIDRGGTGVDQFTMITAMRAQGAGKLLLFTTTMNSSGGLIKIVGTGAFMEQ